MFAQSTAPGSDSAYFRYVISALASDSMQGRLPGTKGEKDAAVFIEQELRRSGCQPLQKSRFAVPFSYLGPDTNLVQSSGDVIGKVNSPSDYCVVVTAHYDHIGYGQHHSNDPFSHAIHNGADDNASGIAMLIALSKWCNDHAKELKQDFIFAAVSGEEDGLYGSQFLLQGNLFDTSHIVCNINLDMVGRLDKFQPLLFAEGVLENDGWKQVLPPDSNAHFIVRRRAVQFGDGSDHCTFLHAHIPAVMFTTGASAAYHRPNDDVEFINYSGMVWIADYLSKVLASANRKDLDKLFNRSDQ